MLASGKNSVFSSDGDDQDRHAEIADPFVDLVDEQEHRLGDEIEPAPIDQQVELIEIELLVVAADIDERKLIPTTALPWRRRTAARWPTPVAPGAMAMRDRAIIGLIGLRRRQLSPAENCARTCALVSGSSAAAQYLSVMPIQALVTSKLTTSLVVDRLIGQFLHALVAHYADQAFMQDVIAGRFRGAVARDQSVGIKRDRRTRRYSRPRP